MDISFCGISNGWIFPRLHRGHIKWSRTSLWMEKYFAPLVPTHYCNGIRQHHDVDVDFIVDRKIFCTSRLSLFCNGKRQDRDVDELMTIKECRSKIGFRMHDGWFCIGRGRLKCRKEYLSPVQRSSVILYDDDAAATFQHFQSGGF